MDGMKKWHIENDAEHADAHGCQQPNVQATAREQSERRLRDDHRQYDQPPVKLACDR
jgi:hypothetical protein